MKGRRELEQKKHKGRRQGWGGVYMTERQLNEICKNKKNKMTWDVDVCQERIV